MRYFDLCQQSENATSSLWPRDNRESSWFEGIAKWLPDNPVCQIHTALWEAVGFNLKYAPSHSNKVLGAIIINEFEVSLLCSIIFTIETFEKLEANFHCQMLQREPVLRFKKLPFEDFCEKRY